MAGHYYICPEEEFEPNMPEQELLKHTVGYVSEYAFQRIEENFSKLPTRPDYDGVITFLEAIDWYRNSNGEPLYADIGKIDLSMFAHEIEGKKAGETFSVNLLKAPITNLSRFNSGLVYGNIVLRIDNDYNVISEKDTYDFDMKPYYKKHWVRNAETLLGEFVSGRGTPFDIFFYGKNNMK